MDLIVYLLLVAIAGLFVGALGRLALPGKDPLTIWQTIAVGVGGSFLAGIVYWIVFDHSGGGIALSVLFSTLIVYLIRRSRGGTFTRPAPRDRY